VLIFTALAGIAASDRALVVEERAVLGTIADHLGIAPGEARHIVSAAALAAARPAKNGESEGVSAKQTETVPHEIALAIDRASRLLGVPSDASRTEIGAAYLRLVARFDPAKLIPYGPDFVALAASKLGELTDAYQALCDGSHERSAA
jgi:DnaJ-domain-containing protein 1